MRGSRFVITVLGGIAMSGPVLAQASDTALRARHEILVMERVLEQKVQFGVQRLNEELRAAGLPEMVLLAGAARARGTRLEGYGVFFDLEVPALRPSMNMLLSLRMDRPDPAVTEALGVLRQLERNMSDAAKRASLEGALATLEAEVGSPAGALRAPQPPGTVAAASVTGAAPVAPPQLPADPAKIYVREVRQAVIDAMFDHSGPMQIAPDEWLTIGARDGMDPRFVTSDPNDVPRTMIIRVRGADLAAFREGRLSREEAVKRVEVSDF